MKNIKKIIICSLLLLLSVSFLGSNLQTQAKSKVSYSFKKGTLTILGKGMMPEKMTFKNNKKIKKVVIKDGITSISNRAFEGCHNIKSVKLPKSIKRIGCLAFYGTKIKNLTIPNGVEVIGEGAFCTTGYIEKVKMPGHGYAIEPESLDPIMYEETAFHMMITLKAKSVIFTNSLPRDISLISDMDAGEFVVSENDSYYSSKDGIIYTKDFTRTVRLPNSKKVKICEGCKVFNITSLCYISDKYIKEDRHYDCYKKIKYGKGDKLRTLILPKSLEYIVGAHGDPDDEFDYGYNFQQPLKKVIIKSKNLSKESIKCLKNDFKYSPLKKGKVEIVYK